MERFTQRVFGLPGSEFFNRHEALLTSLRVLLAPGALAPLIDRLLDSAERQVSAWPEAGGGVELWEASQKLLFTSAAPVLFGDAFFQRAGMQTIFTAFLEFEGAFEARVAPGAKGDADMCAYACSQPAAGVPQQPCADSVSWLRLLLPPVPCVCTRALPCHK